MAYFFRKYHIMSSLKSGSDKEMLTLYKALVPILSLHPAVQKLHTQSLSKNMQLNTNEKNEKNRKKKPLAVILSWLLAKENHLDKYRALYLSRGFDVLTVNIAPKDLLFPVKGSQVVATNVLDYLVNHSGYDNVLVHAFSVGGYMLGEMFVKIQEEGGKYRSLLPRIQGVILDSVVDVEGMPSGLPKAVTRNPITFKVIEWYVSTHLAVMYNLATKHYIKSSKNFFNTPLRCPALFFTSEADKVGCPTRNKMAVDNWAVRGIDVTFKCFKDSKHVGHLYKYPTEYVAEVDNFLKKINLLPSNNL